MTVSVADRIRLVSELRKKIDDLGEAQALAKVGIARRMAEIVALLQGETTAPEALPASNLAAQPQEIKVWLSEQRLAEIEAKVATFQKRAKKLGVAPLTLTKGAERLVRIVRRDEGSGGTSRAIPMDAPVPNGYEPVGVGKQWEVTVLGDLPQLNGWRFVAVLDHMKAGNVVKAVPGGGAVPERFLTAKSLCEHCGTSRNRNKTIVVANTEGKYVQVGSNCVKDFLGHGDAEALMQLAAWRSEVWGYILKEGGDDEWGGSGGSVPFYIEVEQYLPFVAADVRVNGYVSRQKADESGRLSTADYAMQSYSPPRGQKAEIQPTDEDKAYAAAALTWARGMTDEQVQGQSFLHNLRVVASEDAVKPNNIGILAAVIIAYKKHLGDFEAKKDKKPSEWQGQVGKRQVFKGLALRSIFVTEGMYGNTYIHRFEDGDGNLFVWFASRGADLKEGEAYDIKATVKKHDEYKGTKQTTIIRAAVEGKAEASSIGETDENSDSKRPQRVEAEAEMRNDDADNNKLLTERIMQGITYTFPADFRVPMVRGLTVEGGKPTTTMVDDKPVDVIEFKTLVNGKKLLVQPGNAPGLPELVDEYKAMIERGEKAEREALEAAVPGLAELEALASKVSYENERYGRQFERMMEDEGNDGVRPPSAPDKQDAARLEELEAKYPRAALYLKAKGQNESAHWADNSGKGAAGKEAMRILEAGGSIEDAKAALSASRALND